MKRIAVIAGIALLIFSCSIRSPYSLGILRGESGAVLKEIPISQGEIFTIRFIHSVEIAPIYESCYVNDQGQIYLKEVKFEKIGVGYGKYTPTLYPLTRQEGWYYMKNINVPVELNYRVGYVADHTLIVRGKRYQLAKFVDPGELLKLVVIER